MFKTHFPTEDVIIVPLDHTYLCKVYYFCTNTSMVMGQEDVPSTLQLMMISDENENLILIFLIVYYPIDPDFMKLY